jgi:hypothetical protein
MALTTTFKLQGSTDTTIGATDFLAFSNGTFGNPVAVSSYNDGTHVRSSGGVDDSDGNTPNNVKYVASGTADWGDDTEDIADILDAECTLEIVIAYDSNITVTDITMYAYDGSTTTNAPTDMTVQMAESGDSAWTQAHGSGNALAIDDSDTPATSHSFFVSVSASPSTVGVKSANKARIEFTYQ